MLHLFQDVLDKIVYLAVLMPIVASMGGVAATQTLTIVLRGLTLEQINTSNIRWLFKRELAVSILNGIVLSVLVGSITYIWFQQFTLAILIIAIILIVDPKNSASGLSNNPLLGSFSSPSSKQNFVYNLAAVFIASFFLLTLTISYNS